MQGSRPKKRYTPVYKWMMNEGEVQTPATSSELTLLGWRNKEFYENKFPFHVHFIYNTGYMKICIDM